MNNFEFWRKWLFCVGIYLGVFGLVLAFFNQTQLLDFLFNNQIDPVFWSADGIPENMLSFRTWIYGVVGSTVSGWGIFMAFLAYYPFKAREKWAWNCFAVSISIWFVADTSISAYYDVTFNILFNSIILFFIGLPLIFTRKDFSNQPRND